MLLQEISGCEDTKRYFRHIVAKGQIPHAQLFVDNAGGIALPLAFAFLTYLHCTHKREQNACGVCDGCTKMQSLHHPDLYTIFPLGSTAKRKSRQRANPFSAWTSFVRETRYGGIEEWALLLGNETKSLQIRREQVQEMKTIMSKKSFGAGPKTFIIWLPEYANSVATNAMLKMVEEPTPNTYFIFVTANPTAILPTLYSRMWHIHVPKLQDDDLVHLLLQQNPNINRDDLPGLLKLAKGNIQLAQRLSNGSLDNYFLAFSSWLRAAYAHHWDKLLVAADTFHAYHPQSQKNWITYALELTHFVLYLYAEGSLEKKLTQEEENFAHRIVQVLRVNQLQAILQHILYLQEVIQRNAYGRLAFIDCSLRVANALRKT